MRSLLHFLSVRDLPHIRRGSGSRSPHSSLRNVLLTQSQVCRYRCTLSSKVQKKNDVQTEHEPSAQLTSTNVPPRVENEDVHLRKDKQVSHVRLTEGVGKVLKAENSSTKSFKFQHIENKLRELSLNMDKSAVLNLYEKINLESLGFMSIRKNTTLLYYMALFKTYDEALLKKLLKQIGEKLDEVYKPNPIINSLSKSLSMLLIRDTELLNKIVQWYCKRLNTIDIMTATDTIYSLAVLNYLPPEGEVLLSKILESADLTKFENTMKYFNFVWALTLLGRTNEALFKNFFKKSFQNKMERLYYVEKKMTFQLKMCNILSYTNNRGMNLKKDDYKFVNVFRYSLLHQLKDKRRKDLTFKNLLDSVVHLLPPNTFNFLVSSQTGCIIDVVCFFDENHVSVTELDYLKLKSGTKMAVFLLGYWDLCYPDKTIPTGLTLFHKNILESLGYTVLFVRYNEFMILKSLEEKLNLLEAKIKAILPKYKRMNAEWSPEIGA